ncbi:hypothetical protein [Chitinophaga sp. S165]|uniref:hypothetical protein n=1 Tax=Chitinophaga sp. S165 TaxID=2135462 RepID=UPI000D70EA2B|nr:hypothetical protein [Chitinophaga sp. S165]PWV50530.1 hypothetical protein C7475_104151 [Chitinophaga sp. S165]
MEHQIHHHKGNLLRDYVPGVLYVFTFYAMVRFFADACIKFVVGAAGTISYKDHLATRPVLAAIIYFVFCLACYYANRKTFEIIRKESFKLWMKHLGIDILLYGLCILIAAGYNNFVEKIDPNLRNAGLSIALFLVFYCKHEGMRRWYKKERRKLRVVR